MATPVIMPRQGQSVESCIIVEWHKAKGDPVKAGDPLFSYETDKASFEETAALDGELIAVFFQEGDDVPCLTNVCVIGASDDDWQSFIPSGATADGANLAHALAADDLKISPRAKNLAERYQVDLSSVVPTGPMGRIIERDVNRLMDQGTVHTTAIDAEALEPVGSSTVTEQPAATIADSDATPEYVDIKLTQIRKVIARSMHASLAEAAQLTLHTSFDATSMVNLRKQMKQAVENGIAERSGFANLKRVPSVNDFILFAVSRVILAHPDANAHFLGEHIRRFSHVHLGVAVDTPRGLMVPVVRNADLLSVAEIAAEVRALAEQARTGSINPDLIQGSTITVSNLGAFGVESFTPILNPPETCILGVGTLTQKAKDDNGTLALYPSMNLSLTLDHRALDGAPAARFLKDLCFALENLPLLLQAN